MTTATAGPRPAPDRSPDRPRPVQLPGFDRTLEFEPGLRAVALRNVPGTLPVFATHFPRHPILPGVLLLEDMGALAAAASGDGLWLLRSIRTVRFRHFVGPGDQVTLTVERLSRTADTAEWRAEAAVAGRAVATARGVTVALAGAPYDRQGRAS
ncbi:hydroxymyristoyl-ACP dehydratase [Streptomyces sp. NPDC093109]|uniref:3-hydroxyacyl-ACP dehydratase FabZ family protein n=1 Tax=Streptomyces sp. NPDC093109 TaxID=3154977 RepID=UPI00344E1D23